MRENANLNTLLKSKKFLIFAVILIFTLFNVFIFLQTKEIRKTQSNVVPSVTKINKQAETISSSPTKTASELTWNVYRNDTFTFQFPPEWHVQSYPVQNSGIVLTVRPRALPSTVIYPQFIIQTEKASDTALQMKSGFLEGLGLQKSETTIGKTKAIKYSGTIPFKTSGNKTVREPIQDTTMLFTKDDTLYVFKYEYEGSVVNQSLDEYFNDFILSFVVLD